MTSELPRLRNFTPRIMLHDIQALKERSQIIGWLKYSLPGVALVVLLVLICWPQVQKWTHSHKPTLAQTTLMPKTTNTAIRPEYKSSDNKNQPYTITADHGVETSAEEIQLTHPKMVMKLKTGEVVTLTSNSGNLNKVNNQIHLVGNVKLTHSQGYALETTQAWINCDQGSAYSDDPIWGDGPAGSIQAKGFRLSEKGAKVSFLGRAQLLLDSGRKMG